MIARRVPVVLVDEPRTGEHTFIGIDDAAGAQLAAEHLLGLGTAGSAGGLAGLTTVSQPLLENGLTTGRLLVEGDTEPPRDIILPVALRERETTRAPRPA